MALFIVFEGGEGSGKTTQARALARRLVREGRPVLLTKEPGGTRLGLRVRRLVKSYPELTPSAELFLFAASRAQLVTEAIRPALRKGHIVISDRFTPSTIAYQACGRGFEMSLTQRVNAIASDNLVPDLVVLLDLPPEIGLRRVRPSRRDRFEREDLAFHQRVRAGYLALAKAEPARWLKVDATLPRDKVAQLVWEKVKGFLKTH